MAASIDQGRLVIVNQAKEKIRIGISACLIGEKVRYDGGAKTDKYIRDTLSAYFHWVPVCPEFEMGLGVPRPTLRLQRIEGETKLVQPASDRDLTGAMEEYSRARVAALADQNIFGYLLKSGSPSCGKGGIRVYKGHAIRPDKNGVGVFAKHLMEANPNLPIEDEGRLKDPGLREHWLNQVFAFHAFRTELNPSPTIGKLVRFHTRYKFLVLSHCESTYRQLGRLVATAKQEPLRLVLVKYENALMRALKKRSTTARHINVMEHMIGFFRKTLDGSTRAELRASIQDFRLGVVPMIVPMTLIRHHAKLAGITYITEQSYLRAPTSFSP